MTLKPLIKCYQPFKCLAKGGFIQYIFTNDILYNISKLSITKCKFCSGFIIQNIDEIKCEKIPKNYF